MSSTTRDARERAEPQRALASALRGYVAYLTRENAWLRGRRPPSRAQLERVCRQHEELRRPAGTRLEELRRPAGTRALALDARPQSGAAAHAPQSGAAAHAGAEGLVRDGSLPLGLGGAAPPLRGEAAAPS